MLGGIEYAQLVIVGRLPLVTALIAHHGIRAQGFMTAAGVWLVAAIGVTVGLGIYWPAIFITILAFFILMVFGHVEHDLEHKKK